MIRAKITQVLALLVCAGLWACSSSGGGTGDGTGGTGGDGGTGGSNPAVCGNGTVETGEECDDSNTTSGDGCSSFCDIEEPPGGACDDAVDFRGEASYDPASGIRMIVGTIEKSATGQLSGTCGGDGQETVFAYATERGGMLLWLVANPDVTAAVSGVSSYVLTSCDESTEAACYLDSNTGQAIVPAAGTFYIVVDAVETLGSDFDFSLQTIFFPFKEPGEACDPTGQDDICTTGYVCKGTPPTCQEGTAPVIEKGATYFGGDPSYILAAGTDEEEDVVGFTIEPIGADGEPMEIIDLDGDGTPESSAAYIDNAALQDATFGMMGFFGNGDGTWLAVVPTYWTAIGFALWDPAEVVPEVRLTLRDAAMLDSEPFTFGPPVAAGLGEACDNDGFVVCGEGMVCKGAPSVCVEGTNPVITRTMYADRGEARGGPLLLVEGTDPDDDVAFVRMETLDENGAPKAYDIDGDGNVDDMSFELAVTPAEGMFTGGWLLPVGIPQVALTAVDNTARESDRSIVVIAPAVWRQVGQSCDTFGWEACDLGLKCEGETPVCVQGTAPVIPNAAFADTADGPRLMVLVNDVDNDVTVVKMTMLDQAGNPSQYDVFGNGEPVGPVLDLPIADYFDCGEGYCLADFILIDGFIGIPGLRFQALDETGLTSAEITALWGPLPTRALGEPCSTWGFDVCAEGTCSGDPAVCQ